MRPPSYWRVAHASATGSGHLAAGHACQDYTCFLFMPRLSPDTLIAAVADGLGSASHSATGARLSAQAACAHASHLLWAQRHRQPNPDAIESVLSASLLHARTTLEFAALKRHIPLTSLATTLLLLIHTRGLLAAIQVGDGAAVASTALGEYRTLLKPQRGEYANETIALTSRRSLQQSDLTIVRPHTPVRELALTTDGLLNVTMDSTTLEPHPPFFSKMSHWLRTHDGAVHPNTDLGRILSSGFIARRTPDDVSLLIAVDRQFP